MNYITLESMYIVTRSIIRRLPHKESSFPIDIMFLQQVTIAIIIKTVNFSNYEKVSIGRILHIYT